MTKKLTIFLIMTASLLFTACGGGGGGGSNSSSSNNSNSTKSLSGNVVDGPIKGANVTVQCQGGNYGPATTNDIGEFSIQNIGSNIDLNTCIIYAKGGNDGVNDFTNLTLKAPYSLAGTTTGINITPITTLVANHDGNITDAKSAISSFLNISVDELKKNPNKNIALLRKAMMLTKIAQKQGKFLDVDGQKGQNNALNGDINNLITSLDDDLKDVIENIKDPNLDSIEKIEKKVSEKNVFNALKKAYKLNTFETNQKENLMYLAKKIVEANKKNNKYQVISKHHLRKALTDVGLSPKFSDDNYSILHDDLKKEFEKSEIDFKTLIDGKTISISEIKDFVLFDAKSYEQIVGYDQEKRRNYYAFSNKSNIANIISLIDENSFTEQNDAINEYTARGLAKLGLSDDAISHMEDTILIPDNKYTALNWLGKDFTELKEKEKALESLTKAFDTFKTLTNKDSSILLTTAHRLKNIDANEKFEEVLEFAVKLAKDAGGYFGWLAAIDLEKAAVSAYEKDNNLNAAKDFAKSAIEPNLENTIGYFKISGLYTNAITAEFFGESQAASNAIIEARKADTGNSKTAYDFAYNSLKTTNIETDITNFSTLIKKKDALLNGFAASLVANNKLDTLIEYYKDTNIFSSEKDVAKQIAVTFGTQHYIAIPPALGIELLSSKDKKIKYLDKMYDLMTNTWKITTDSDIQSIYATWGDKDLAKTGYLALAYEYNKEGKSEKVQKIFNTAITKVTNLTSADSLQKGVNNIIKASNAMNIDISANVSEMIEKIKSLSLKVKSEDAIKGLISSAKLLTQYDKNAAISILNHAKTLVPKIDSNSETINDDVDDIVEFLIGKGTFSNFDDSLAYAYYLANDKKNTQNLIDEAIDNINILGTFHIGYSKLIARVVVAYAALNDIENTKKYLAKVRTVKEKEKSAIEAAIGLYQYDAFESSIASIDSDLDGEPDFFSPKATVEEIRASGLNLDEDIDNDNKKDTLDKLPYDNI